MDPEKALNACPQNGTTILLVHQPLAAAKILDETNQKIDLVLSGFKIIFSASRGGVRVMK
jgi:predicted MPP superfamily phosphohydrolase